MGLTEVFVPSYFGRKKGFEHGKCQVVVVLTCSRDLTCILLKVSRKGFKVLASILGWMASLDYSLEVFEALN